MRIDLTKMQVAAVAAHVRDMVGEDDDLLLDCLEGETNLFELSSRLLNHIEHDEGQIAALTQQITDRQDRKGRADKRIKARREAIMALMDCGGIDKLPLPEATLTVRSVSPKPVVNDEAAIPDSLCRFKRSPDMSAIKTELETGRAVSGVTLDNGGQSLTIRRK